MLRRDVILAGKKRFREIRTALGQDIYHYRAPNLTFIQKLNNLIAAQGAVADEAKPGQSRAVRL